MEGVPVWLVGVDVGGTFTDGVLIRPGGPPVAVKTPTDLEDPLRGLAACLDELARAAGVDRLELLARTGRLAYGTTQAANMAVQGRWARAGFITTAGFRDTLVIAGIGRDRIGMDLTASRAPSLIPRRLIAEVRERIDREGLELAPLVTADVLAAAERFRAEGVESVGVCLLWSFRNPAHEAAVADLLRSLDGWFVSLSSEVAPLMGEYERSATTALNALLGPPVRRHLEGARQRLAEDGFRGPLLIMQSSGGVVPVAEAIRRPVTLLASGPAGGVLACRLLGAAMGVGDIVCADMGGTTFDVSLVTRGEHTIRGRTLHAGQELYLPSIDIQSIGAGGGSLGWVDHGRRLKVGPESAGARPGPACYGQGGTRATVTDASCLLGLLNPEGLAGGRLALDREAAHRALADLGRELDMDAREVADGMLDIVDAAMADAIGTITVRQGLDPTGYALFAYGGAAPLHAAGLARELGIRRVVVPDLAPVLSAYGVVASDVLHALAVTGAHPLTDPAPFADSFARLEAEARRLLDADGIPPERRLLARSAEVRFLNQLHAVEVPVRDGPFDGAALAALRDDFLAAYERLFGPGTSSPGAGIEASTLRLNATGLIAAPALEPEPAIERVAAPAGEREVWCQGRRLVAARHLAPLPPGSRLEGPALVDGWGHTAWVPPGVRARVDGFRSLVMEL